MKAEKTSSCSVDWGCKQLREIARSMVLGNQEYSDIEYWGWKSYRSLMQKVSSFCCESIILTKSNITNASCWYGSSVDRCYWLSVDQCFLRQALVSWSIGSLVLNKSDVACF